MAEYLTPQAVAMIGLFAGVAFRYFAPYLRKTIKDNLPLKWEHKYTALLIISAGIAVMLYPRFQVPSGDLLTVFSGAFIYGTGLGELLAEGYAWLKTPEKEEKPPE